MENVADCGMNIKGLLRKLNHDMPSLKMLRICEVKDLQPSSKIYGRSGMTVNGTLYLLAPLVLATSEREFGLLPTPEAREVKESKNLSSITKSYYKRKYPSLTIKVLYEVATSNFRLPTVTTFDSGSPLPPRRKNNTGGQKPPLVSVMCSEKSMRLNPQFTEAMMGYPIDWTSV